MPVEMHRLISFHSTRPVKGFIIVIFLNAAFCWRKLLQLARVSRCKTRDLVTALCKRSPKNRHCLGFPGIHRAEA